MRPERRLSALRTLFAVVVLVGCVLAQPEPPKWADYPQYTATTCDFTTPQGWAYSMSGITASGPYTTGPDYDKSDGPGKYTFSIVPCGNTLPSTVGNGYCDSNSIGCQYWPYNDTTGRWHSRTLGTAPLVSATTNYQTTDTMTVWTTLVYNNGESCNAANANLTRSVWINVFCANDSEISFEFEGESSLCEYGFSLYHPAGCPVCTSKLCGLKGFSAGSILIIIFVVVVCAYCLFGVLFNKLVRHKEGVELVPNAALWQSFLGYIKDGFTFTGHILRCRRDSRGTYEAA